MTPHLQRAIRRFAVSASVLAVMAAGAATTIHAHATPVPETITPEWYARHFPGCIDLPCGPRPLFWQQVLWHQVAHRPDFLRAAHHVARDPRRDVLTRSRAIRVVAMVRGER